MSPLKPRRLLAGLALALSALSGLAQPAPPTVKDAWIRGTVPQQKATGLFAQITSPAAARLVEARSPAAGVVEIHEMQMDGSTMRMRALPALELPAGRTVELKPGGFHVMLMDLKKPLQAGETVPVSLVFEAADKSRQTVELQVPVRALNAQGGMGAGHSHGKH